MRFLSARTYGSVAVMVLAAFWVTGPARSVGADDLPYCSELCAELDPGEGAIPTCGDVGACYTDDTAEGCNSERVDSFSCGGCQADEACGDDHLCHAKK